MTIFLACMLLYPEAQRKAQEEIDRVVGRDRLPDLNDRKYLPYVECVLHEVMRSVVSSAEAI
jgi:cytochrome P450